MKFKCLVLCLSSLLWVTGCGLTNLLGLPTSSSVDPAQFELDTIDAHLTLMRDITSSNYQQQQQLYSSISKIQQDTGDARANFRYALVLLTSGHPNSDPGRGYNELKQLLETDNDLTARERNLAQVLLNEAENSMILEARNTELTSAASLSQFEKNQDGNSSRVRNERTNQQLRAAQQKITELQSQLEEARNKLDEIKEIEVQSE